MCKINKDIKNMKDIVTNFIKRKKEDLPYIFGAIAILSAFIGYLAQGNDFFQSFYASFGFLGGNGDIDSMKESILLQIAGVFAPLSVGALIVTLFYRKIKDWQFLTFNAKEHFVICGLGDMGKALAEDLLQGEKFKQKKYSKLVIIELNELNPHIEDMREKGAIVLTGDAREKTFLQTLTIQNAKTVVFLSGDDIVNLDIIVAISEMRTKASLYIHLENRENYELLRSETFKDLNIKSFSIYDSAAQTLFMKHPLGCNVDTTKEETTVRVALVGFDKVGESLLYRILNLGHFYNQEPIEVDVFDFDMQNKEREFLKSYPIKGREDIAKDYWKVTFKDEPEFYVSDIDYTQIIFCSRDSKRSFQDAMRFMKTHADKIGKFKTQVYIFGDTHYGISSLLQNNNNIFKNLHTFGLFSELCTYDVVVNEELDAMAKSSNAGYNNLHGYNEENKNVDEQWNELDSFLKDSNRMQVEHLAIKLKVVNSYLGKKETQSRSYEEIKQDAIERWFVHGGKMLWDDMHLAKELAMQIPLDVLERLAQVEHNRWNAFHILHGWKKLDISEDTKEKIGKDKKQKLHPCLVRWGEELDEVSKNHKHDYKSDDIETVMRVGDMLKDIDLKIESEVKELINKFCKITTKKEQNQ